MTYISFFFHLQLYCLISQGAVIEDTCAEAMCSDDQCQREKIGDTCFYLYGNSTWEENKELCISKGMQMSKMSASSHLQNNSVVWLGGRVKWFEKWTFVKGILLEETYHNPRSTAGTPHNLCGVVQYTKEDITLSFANCMDTYRFICRFGDWRGRKTFYTSDLKANWFDAHSRCRALSAELYYQNKGEAVTMLKKRLCLRHTETFFIGLTHGMWTWENGQDILVENWPTGIQSIMEGDCLAIDLKNNKWIAKKCDETLKALCEEKRTTTKNSSAKDDSIPQTSNESGWPIIRPDVIITASVLGTLLLLALLVISIMCRLNSVKKTSNMEDMGFQKGDVNDYACIDDFNQSTNCCDMSGGLECQMKTLVAANDVSDYLIPRSEGAVECILQESPSEVLDYTYSEANGDDMTRCDEP